MYGSRVRVPYGLPFFTYVAGCSFLTRRLPDVVKHFFKRVRHVPEALAFLLGFVLLPWWPRRCLVWLASGIGTVFYGLARRQRRVALANLTSAFGDEMDARRRHTVARGAFISAVRVVLDFFWFAIFSERRIGRWVHFDESFRHYFETSPAIAVTGHIGNWELMSQAMALRGHPYVGVAAPLDNPIVDAVVNAVRQRGGQRVVRKAGAVREVIAALKAGGRTVVLIDQNIVPRDGGVFVDYFGLPVPVSNVVHTLGARTGARAVFIYCLADSTGCYTAHACPAVEIERTGTGGQSATQEMTGLCETVVRDHPEDWFWMYKRWRYVPPGRSPDGYPFYAESIPEPFLRHGAREADA